MSVTISRQISLPSLSWCFETGIKVPLATFLRLELARLKIVPNPTRVVKQFISCVSVWQETRREQDRVTAMSVSWRCSTALSPTFPPQTSAR